MSNENQSTFKEYFLPISILVAAVLISVSLVVTAANSDQTANTKDAVTGNKSAKNVAEVTEDDHIRGSMDAPIKIVEYSDLECPYCNSFHDTMKKVMDEYGDQVAWVYRHFPLTNIHPEAKPAAEASECVADLGGNEAFWSFTDYIFENQARLGSGLITEAATNAGVSESELQSCLDSDKYLADVESDQENGIESGAQGTPYSVIITENGNYSSIPGALPYTDSNPNRPDVKTILDGVISNL